MAPSRRRKKLIDWDVQYGLIRRMAIHWGLFLIANTLLLLCWTRFMGEPSATWSETMAIFGERYFPMFLVAIALLPVFFNDALKLSNRFAGPVMRLRRALTELSAGEKTDPLSFRHNDFWHALARDFNRIHKLGDSEEAKG